MEIKRANASPARVGWPRWPNGDDRGALHAHKVSGSAGFAAAFLAGLLVMPMCPRFAQGAFAVEFLFQTPQGFLYGFAFLEFYL